MYDRSDRGHSARWPVPGLWSIGKSPILGVIPCKPETSGLSDSVRRNGHPRTSREYHHAGIVEQTDRDTVGRRWLTDVSI